MNDDNKKHQTDSPRVFVPDASCPSPETLVAYREEKLSGNPSEAARVEAHLLVCPQCSREFEELQAQPQALPPWTARSVPLEIQSVAATQRTDRVAATVKGFAVGDVYRARGTVTVPGSNETVAVTEEPPYVVITLDDADAYDETHPDIRVAPISFSVEHAGPYDRIVEADESPFGCELMVECWNEQPMLKETLGDPVAPLNERIVDDLRLLLASFVAGASAKGLSGRVGSVLTESDLRIRFQQAEREVTEYLRAPIAALVAAWEKEEHETSWARLIELARKRGAAAAIDLADRFTAGVFGPVRILAAGPVPALRGTSASPAASHVLEVTLGANVYSMEVRWTKNDELVCDLGGRHTPMQEPLTVSLRSESGHELLSQQTDAFGNTRFVVSPPSGSGESLMLTLKLRDLTQELVLRIPSG